MTTDSEDDLTAPNREEAATLALLRDWGAMPVDPPDAAESAAARLRVVGHMTSTLRDERARRIRGRKRTIAFLVAIAAVLVLGSTALAFVAGRQSRGGSSKEANRENLTVQTAPATASPTSEASIDNAAVPATSSPSSSPPTASVASPQEISPHAIIQARPHSAEASSETAPAPPTPSELAEQNKLFLAAMSARKRGDDAETVRDCDALLTRYPNSPLAREARAERDAARTRISDAPTSRPK